MVRRNDTDSKFYKRSEGREFSAGYMNSEVSTVLRGSEILTETVFKYKAGVEEPSRRFGEVKLCGTKQAAGV